MNNNLIQSYIKGKFCVSTIYRQSSACTESPPWYYETIIWEWDSENKKLGKILGQVDSGSYEEGALKSHCGIVMRLDIKRRND